MDEQARTDTPARPPRPPGGPAATGRPRRVHVCMNLSPWCSITHSCAPWLLLIDSELVESGHGWPELARPGGHGTCLQLAPHCSSGDGLQLLRGCGVLPSLSPNRSRYSWVCRVLARNFCSEAWIGSRWLYGRFTWCSSSDAEQRRSISGAGWETLIIWSRCLATGDLATNSAWR